MIKILCIIILLLSSPLPAQKYKVLKIIDADKYQLENGDIVSPAEVFIPSIAFSEQKYKQLSNEIINWAENFLVNRSIKAEFLVKNNDSVLISFLYIPYTFSDEDLAKRMISMGYAINQSSLKSPKYQEYFEAEKTARKQKLGIWKFINEDEIATLPRKTGDLPYLRATDSLGLKTYSYNTKPYISLLPLGISFFIISWDAFNEADIDGLPNDIVARKLVVGLSTFVAGIFTTVFALKNVRVTYDQNNFNIRINL